jgi:AcrR family transcriptional regulator
MDAEEVARAGRGAQAAEARPDRRRALVAAAFARIAADGFEGLRTREVAADVGVNIATLHYYFPSKEALIRAVIGSAMQRFIETMPGQGSPTEQLRTHLAGLAHLLKTDRQLWTVLGELVLRAARDADLERIFRESDQFWHRSLGELIRRCVDEGTAAPLLEPDALAALMIASIRGLSLPTGARFQPRLADQIFDSFQRLLGLPFDSNVQERRS